MNIEETTFEDLKHYYDKILNYDKSSYKSSNDEPTPIDCVEEIIDKIPQELWSRGNLTILDPCCGNGNFFLPLFFDLLKKGRTQKDLLEKVFTFNDINQERLANVREVFCENKYKLQIKADDFLSPSWDDSIKYDLIVANPPYAKILENGKRASKNHNLIKEFIDRSLKLLKPGGYLAFLTPDNWMSYADRNTLIETLTRLQIIHLDIHNGKKYFKKIGSSFTWYVIENHPFYKPMIVSGIWKKNQYITSLPSGPRKYIPLLYNNLVQRILAKTVDHPHLKKFAVKTSSDLHRYTKKLLISNDPDPDFPYRLIHTPKQTVYASRPHKFQEGYKVFISTTDKYSVFIDQEVGMTQSIAFILCPGGEEEAQRIQAILQHPLYVFINNICRWGNFNNIRILQHFPIPPLKNKKGEEVVDEKKIFDSFNITKEEQEYLLANL